MDIALLRTFLEVSKTRHFGKAAQNLYITQSAVSFRIRQLEETVGVALFTRQRNNIMLTPAGERLIPHAENMLAAWQLALQDVGLPEEQDIYLSLGGISNLWGAFLQSLLPKLAETFPQISIRTEINSHLELARSLIAGRLDIAVMLDPPTLADLTMVRIGDIELVMVCHQPQKRFSQVKELGYVFVDWGTAFNLKHAKLFKKPIAPILHTEQSQIALEFIMTNGGAAFLPRVLVQPYLDNGTLYLLEDVEPVRRAVFAVFNKAPARQRKIMPFIECLTELELKPEANLQPSL